MANGMDSFRLENVSDIDEPSVYSSGNGSSDGPEGDSEGDSQAAFAIPVGAEPTPPTPAGQVSRMDVDDRSVDSISEGEDMSMLGTEGAEDHGANIPGAVAAIGVASATTVTTSAILKNSSTDPTHISNLAAPTVKSNEIPSSITKLLKEREETERARRNKIILVAVVTAIVVLGVSLGVGLGYSKPPPSETPAWSQDGSST
jgi:hypothetical protein